MSIRFLIFTSIFILSGISHTNEYVYSNGKLSDLLTQAEKLAEDRQYKTAIDIYNEALKIASNEQLVDDSSYIYKKIGFIHYKQKEYERAKASYKNSIFKAPNSQNAADSYFNLSLIYRKQKIQDSLLWALNKSLKIYNTQEDSEAKFSTYLKAGIIYKQLGSYNEAINYLLLAYEGFNDGNHASKKASVCYTIGETQRLLGNFEIAKKYLIESLQIRTKLKGTLKTSYAHNNLGNLYKDLGQYDSASVHYEKAIRIQNSLKNTREIGKMLNNLASTYFLLNRLDLARSTYKKALDKKRQEQDTLSLSYTFNELALISIQAKEPNLARQYLDSARYCLSDVSKKEAWLRYYEIESAYYTYVDSFKNAYKYQTLQFNLYKEVFSEQQSKTIQMLQEQFESRLKEQQISNLTNDNLQKATTIVSQKKHIQNTNLLLGL
ncbi:MAG: tetratricopeptide repeat protein [Xanthomarina gelatinilytica]|uniref:tetratricopeptide repeat protein n=1 Tax=Xanthomarina gelatinilytica TaxID=1137281 RepID=UPI003A84241D